MIHRFSILPLSFSLEADILITDEVPGCRRRAEFSKKKPLKKMQDISKGEGRTVLFVSHNTAAVKYLCNERNCSVGMYLVLDGCSLVVFNYYVVLNQ
jgi:lipopolysaccharide transport system ATP-binding protein